MKSITGMKVLYESLQRRYRPEDIAELVRRELLKGLSDEERVVLDGVARYSLQKDANRWTAMPEDFHQPVPPSRQIDKARELCPRVAGVKKAAYADPTAVSAYERRLSATIGRASDAGDFKKDRNRRLLAPGMSRRRYNKLFRFTVRLARKVETLQLELRKCDAAMVAKSGLATRIAYEDFAVSREAACFVAYYTARRNRRSVFTNQKQDRPYDKLAAMLLERFRRSDGRAHQVRYRRVVGDGESPTVKGHAGWRAVAMVLPEAVAELSRADQAALWGRWMAELHELAELLRQTWKRSGFKRETMIVKRGDDSSTWNALAGAWNAARQGWLATAMAMGAEALVEACCVGKVMRLMAADVAYWHRASGGGLDPDTLVWADLPAPWEVLTGKATCTRQQVEDMCAKHKVDPVKKGWTSLPGEREVVPFMPTPELVHGVAVAHPELVPLLRKAGWFSGKGTRVRALPKGTKVALTVGETGAVLGAASVEDSEGE